MDQNDDGQRIPARMPASCSQDAALIALGTHLDQGNQAKSLARATAARIRSIISGDLAGDVWEALRFIDEKRDGIIAVRDCLDKCKTTFSERYLHAPSFFSACTRTNAT